MIFGSLLINNAMYTMKNHCLKIVIMCLIALASLFSCTNKERCEDCVPYDWKVAESVVCSAVECDVQVYDGTSCNIMPGSLSVDYVSSYSLSLRLDLNVPDGEVWHLSVGPIDVSGEVGLVYLKPICASASYSCGNKAAVHRHKFEVEGYRRCVNIAELILSQDSHPKTMSGCITLCDKDNADAPYRLVFSNFHGEF